MHSLGIVQWNSTRRDHPGNHVGVSGSGPVTMSTVASEAAFNAGGRVVSKNRCNLSLEAIEAVICLKD